MARQQNSDGDPVIIKKYANRRLYNTSSSSYITLEDLARMTREGVDFQVVDAKTGSDITHSILTQIIMDEEANGEQMLPVSFLRQLISMYGNSMQAMMPHYLEASMSSFRANQSKLQEAFECGMGANPFAKIAQNNLAMFKAAAAAFMPPTSTSPQDTASEKSAPDDEISALREQMEQMQRKLDQLGK